MENKEQGLRPIESYSDLLNVLKDKAERDGITNYRISRDTGLLETTVKRMMSNRNEAKFSNILLALKSLGVSVFADEGLQNEGPLSKEDIESLGWSQTVESQVSTFETKSLLAGHCNLYFQENPKQVVIANRLGAVFAGRINNLSELKMIMHMVRITQ
jgi:hypothetical protein